MKPIALIVAPTLNERVVRYLAHTDFDLHVVSSFEMAKARLLEQPDLLITEVRLAEYNGLHLALRAQARSIPTIIIGAADRLFEQDAERFGARYVDVAAVDELAHVVRRMTAEGLAAEQKFVPAVELTSIDPPIIPRVALAG